MKFTRSILTLICICFALASAASDSNKGRPGRPKSTGDGDDEKKRPAAPTGATSTPTTPRAPSLPTSSTGVARAAGLPATPATPRTFDDSIPDYVKAYNAKPEGPTSWNRREWWEKQANRNLYFGIFAGNHQNAFFDLLRLVASENTFQDFMEIEKDRLIKNRDSAALKSRKKILGDEREGFMNRYKGVDPAKLDKAWDILAEDIPKPWLKESQDRKEKFRQEFASRYPSSGAAAAAVGAAAASKRKRDEDDEEDDDDSEYIDSDTEHDHKKCRHRGPDDEGGDDAEGGPEVSA